MGTQNSNLTAEADGTFAVVNLPKFVGFSVDNSQLLQQAVKCYIPSPSLGMVSCALSRCYCGIMGAIHLLFQNKELQETDARVVMTGFVSTLHSLPQTRVAYDFSILYRPSLYIVLSTS